MDDISIALIDSIICHLLRSPNQYHTTLFLGVILTSSDTTLGGYFFSGLSSGTFRGCGTSTSPANGIAVVPFGVEEAITGFISRSTSSICP